MTLIKKKSFLDSTKEVCTSIIAVAAVMSAVMTIGWKAFAEPVIDKQITEKTQPYRNETAEWHKIVIARMDKMEQIVVTLERVMYAKMTPDERQIFDEMSMNPPRRLLRR